MTNEAILSALEARRSGAGYVARCVAHEDSRPSMSIAFSQSGKLLVHCHAHCTQDALFAALRARGLLQRDHDVQRATVALAGSEEKRIALARAVWRDARPIHGSLAETYLRARGIKIELPPTLKFAASVFHRESAEELPALVAGVAIHPSHAVTAVQRIFLRRDGKGKARVSPAKKSLGAVRGGAVRLAKIGSRLGLTEGIEDALTAMQLDPALPMWATLGASNLKHVILPDPPLAAEVVIVADNDANGTGLQEAEAAAERFTKQGRLVRIAKPPKRFKDFNEALMANVPDLQLLTPEQREAFEERAAIMEFDGGMARPDAESASWQALCRTLASSPRGAV